MLGGSVTGCGFASAFIARRKPGLIGKVAAQNFYFRSEAGNERNS